MPLLEQGQAKQRGGIRALRPRSAVSLGHSGQATSSAPGPSAPPANWSALTRGGRLRVLAQCSIGCALPSTAQTPAGRRTRAHPPGGAGSEPQLGDPSTAAGFLPAAVLRGPSGLLGPRLRKSALRGAPGTGPRGLPDPGKKGPTTTFSQVLASPRRRREAAAGELPPKERVPKPCPSLPRTRIRRQ